MKTIYKIIFICFLSLGPSDLYSQALCWYGSGVAGDGLNTSIPGNGGAWSFTYASGDGSTAAMNINYNTNTWNATPKSTKISWNLNNGGSFAGGAWHIANTNIHFSNYYKNHYTLSLLAMKSNSSDRGDINITLEAVSNNGDRGTGPSVLLSSIKHLTNYWQQYDIPLSSLTNNIANWRSPIYDVRWGASTAVTGKAEIVYVDEIWIKPPKAYYVNGSSTVNDKFCSEIGNDLNSGLLPSLPKRTITNLLRTYPNIGPGATIFVDTGTYNECPRITNSMRGSFNSNIIIQGAGISNQISLVSGGAANSCFSISNSSYVKIMGFKFKGNSGCGINIVKSCSNIKIVNNTLISNTTSGLFISNSRHCSISNNRSSYNTSHGIYASGCTNLAIGTNIASYNLGTGVRLLNVRNSTIGRLIATHNVDGLDISSTGNGSSSNVTVLNSTLSSNSGIGLFPSTNASASYPTLVMIQGCTVRSNHLYGIALDRDVSLYLRSSDISLNNNAGIYDEVNGFRNTHPLWTSNCSFSSNIGNAIILYPQITSMTMMCSTFTANTNGITHQYNGPPDNVNIYNNVFRRNIINAISLFNNLSHPNFYVVHQNIFIGNSRGIYVGAENNLIFRSNTFYTNAYGVYLEYGNYIGSNVIQQNKFVSGGSNVGVFISETDPTKVYKNNVSGNTFMYLKTGVDFEGASTYNIVQSNIFLYGTNGIYINNQYGACCSLSNYIFRNAFFKNTKGVYFTIKISGAKIINNTFVSNSQATGSLFGAPLDYILRNNIAAFNGQGFNGNSATVTATYNDSYQNNVFNNSNFSPGTGSISNAPLFASTDPTTTNFLCLTKLSPCIGAGDPADPVPTGGGTRIDQGWKEFIYTGYFVNDNSTVGDVFCSQAGNDANSGLFPNAPKRTITNLLRTYPGIPPGSIIYVDTGTYSECPRITNSMRGANGSFITFQGAGILNQVSLVSGGAPGNGFCITNSSYIRITGFKAEGNPGCGINIVNNCTNIKIDHNTLISNTISGLKISNSRQCIVSNDICSYNTGNGIYASGCTNLMVGTNFVSYNQGTGACFMNARSTTITRLFSTHNLNGIEIRSRGPCCGGGTCSSNVTILNSVLSSNSQKGVFISTNDTQNGPVLVSMNGCSMRSNHGGGFSLGRRTSVYIRNSDLSLNNGGGIYDFSGISIHSYWASNCSFNSNIGSGVYLTGDVTSVTLMNSTLKGNTNGLNNSARDRIKIFKNTFSANFTYGILSGSGNNRPVYHYVGSNTFIRQPYGLFNAQGRGITYEGNIFYTNSTCIWLASGNFTGSNIIRGNLFKSAGTNVGILHQVWSMPAGNNIVGNTFQSLRLGMDFDGQNKNVIIQSNIFLNNTNGLNIRNGGGLYVASNFIMRNAFFRNNIGINLVFGNITGTVIRNNTFVSNIRQAVYCSDAGNAFVLRNNIAAYNNQGFNANAGTGVCTYNDVFGNTGASYLNLAAGTGSISNAPLFASYDPTDAVNFLVLNPASPCIDAGDPSDPVPQGGGTRVDQGWKECLIKSYYVNDTVHAGDVFCSQIGNDANDGLATNTPKRTITNLLRTYPNIGPRSVIYVDTGTYNECPRITNSMRGLAGTYITFQGAGSNNQISLVSGGSANSCFIISNSSYIRVTGFKAKGGSGYGFNIVNNCTNIKIDHNSLVSNATSGLKITNSRQCVISNNICSYNMGNGIYASVCANLLIGTNLASYNLGNGVRILNVKNSTISRLFSTHNAHGMDIHSSGNSCSSNLTLLNSIFSSNAGGGILLTNSTGPAHGPTLVLMNGCSIRSNHYLGFQADYFNSVYIRNSDLSLNNTAGFYDSVNANNFIHAFWISNCTFSSNIGNGLYIGPDVTSFTLMSSMIRANTNGWQRNWTGIPDMVNVFKNTFYGNFNLGIAIMDQKNHPTFYKIHNNNFIKQPTAIAVAIGKFLTFQSNVFATNHIGMSFGGGGNFAGSNYIQGNLFYSGNSNTGLSLSMVSSNLSGNNISGNTFRNLNIGVNVGDQDSFITIQSNLFLYDTNGIYMANGWPPAPALSRSNFILRNAFFYNAKGINLGQNLNGIVIRNNTFVSNKQQAVYSAGGGTIAYILRDNIAAYNGQGFNANFGTAVCTYNDVFGNIGASYINLTAGTGSISNAPLFASSTTTNTNFLYLTGLSPCINAGDPADPVPSGALPPVDQGWKEFFGTIINNGPFYVSTNGNDTYPGTFGLPFRNIQRGVDVISAVQTIPTLYIGPGIYTQNVMMKSNKNAPSILAMLVSLTNTKRALLYKHRAALTISNANAVVISNLNIGMQTNCGINVTGTSTNIRIVWNTIYSNWRGIRFNGRRMRAIHNTLTGNLNTGIIVTNGTCILSNNLCAYSTNGILVVSITNCSMVSNITVNNSLDGIVTRNVRTCTIQGSTSTRNFNGLAIRELGANQFSSNVVIQNSTMSTNTGRGIFVTNQNTAGAGPAVANVNNSVMRSNHLAGLQADQYSSSYVRNSDISLNNTAGIKDIYNAGVTPIHSFWISNCSINSNIGAGIYARNSITSFTMMYCTITGNSNGVSDPGPGNGMPDRVNFSYNTFIGNIRSGMNSVMGNGLHPISYLIYKNNFIKQPYGIYLNQGKAITFKSNVFFTNGSGLFLATGNFTGSNYIMGNTFRSGGSNTGIQYVYTGAIPSACNISGNTFFRLKYGMDFDGGHIRDTIQSNLFLYCTNGVYAHRGGGSTSISNYFLRNAFFRDKVGIDNSAGNQITGYVIVNNDFVSNVKQGVNLAAGTNFIRNNIAYNNWRGFQSTGSNLATYNDAYGNKTNYVGIFPSTGSISNNPLFASYDPTDNVNFLYLTSSSPCINAGDPADPVPSGGVPPVDQGWKEFMGNIGPFYVSTNGLDTNPGTFALPFKNIQRGVDVISTGQIIPTLYIGPGIYTQNVTMKSNKNTIATVLVSLTNAKRALLYGRFTALSISNANSVIISNLNIGKQTNYGINVTGTSTNIRIVWDTIYSNWRGIKLKNKRMRAIHNILTGNLNCGICVTNSTTILSNNTVTYSTNGIRVSMCTNFSMVSNVTVNNSLDGINVDSLRSSTIQGSLSTHNANGIDIRYFANKSCTNITILNSMLSSNSLRGIFLTNSAAAYPTKAFINGCVIRSNQKFGLQFRDYTSINLKNSDFSLNSSVGIKDTTTAGATPHHIWMSNCSVNSNTGQGLYFGPSITSCTLMSSVIIGNNSNGIARGNTGPVDYVNIYKNTFKENVINGINLSTPNKVVSYFVKNNNFIRNRTYGFFLSSGRNIIFQSNVFSTNGTGLYLNGANSVGTNIVLQNTFQSWKSNTGMYYLWNQGFAPMGNISGNVFKMLRYGLDFDGQQMKVTIQSNLFIYCTNGLYIRNGSGNLAFSNYIKRNAFFRNTRGIHFPQGNSLVSNNLILNNTFVSNKRQGVYDAIPNSSYILRNNIFYGNAQGVSNNINVMPLSSTYNDAFGNKTNYMNMSPGTGCISNNPQFASFDPTATNFLYLTASSPCINAGDPADPVPSGAMPPVDQGWKEYMGAINGGPFFVDDTSGDDANLGTFAQPFRTIQKADRRMQYAANVTSATTYVFPGSYPEQVLIATNWNGKPMVFVNLSNTLPVLSGSLASNNAFLVSGTANIIIRGMKIRQYVNGLQLNQANNISIKNVTLISNTSTGMKITNCSQCSISNNICSYNTSFGIYASWCTNLAIGTNITSYNLASGVRFVDVRNTTISRLVSTHNGDGLDIRSPGPCCGGGSQSSNIVVLNSVLSSNSGRGVMFNTNATANYPGLFLLNGCSIRSNHSIGILPDTKSVVYIRNSDISLNNIAGINDYIQGGTYPHSLWASNCSFSSNIGVGIRILGNATSFTLISSTMTANTNGFYGNIQDQVNFSRNSFTGNFNEGIGIFNQKNHPVQYKVYNNIFKKQPNGIQLDCGQNMIFQSNVFSTNGIGVNMPGNNTIASNYFYGNLFSSGGQSPNLGLCFSGNGPLPLANKVSANIFRNLKTGIQLNRQNNFNTIQSNIFLNNTNGITLLSPSDGTCLSNFFIRNAFFRNIIGVNLGRNTSGTVIRNNTFVSNSQQAVYSTGGVPIDYILRNNIATYNGQGFNANTGTAVCTYNDVYGNTGPSYVNLSAGTGSISNAPLLASYDPTTTNFLYLTASSPCIDAGDPADPVPPGGTPPVDQGWKEFFGSYFKLSINKSVSNITYPGAYTSPVPGSLITYKIVFSVTGSGGKPASNIIVSDQIKTNLSFYSNRIDALATGWTNEFSTNTIITNLYVSPNFSTNHYPGSKVKWVRWKSPTVTPTSTHTIIIKAIIK